MKLNISWQKNGLVVPLIFIGACGSEQIEPIPFLESSEISGLHFTHHSEATERMDLSQIMGGGVALIDYDQDGDLDVYLLQGPNTQSVEHQSSDLSIENIEQVLDDPTKSGDQLFRNDSSSKGVRFQNVTLSAGIEPRWRHMGVAVGDLNSDGFPDLFLAGIERNRILINLGSGQFREHPVEALLTENYWSSSATIADFNGDEKLDIFIGRFVDLASAAQTECRSNSGLLDHCQSDQYDSITDQLLINQGNNEQGYPLFEDRTKQYGLSQLPAATSTVTVADFDNDQWLDVHIANNAGEDLLLFNQGGQKFDNRAKETSADRGMFGAGVNSMGVDIADIDHDGDVDLLVAYSDSQVVRILENNGQGSFIDVTDVSGIQASQHATGGVAAIATDYDLNGTVDLYLANGATRRQQTKIDQGDNYALRLDDQWFVQKHLSGIDQESALQANIVASDSIEASQNKLIDSVELLTESVSRADKLDSLGDIDEIELNTVDRDKTALNNNNNDQSIWSQVMYGDGLKMPSAQNSRGIAIGDIDNDGDSDFVINNNGARASLLINSTDPDNWVGVTAKYASQPQTVIGARAKLVNGGMTTRSDYQFRSRGYASSSDPRIRLVVASDQENVNVLVTWPDGMQELYVDRAVRQYHALIKGEGINPANDLVSGQGVLQ